MSFANLFTAASEALQAAEPEAKCARTHALVAAWQAGELTRAGVTLPPVDEPGRPVRPELVPPRALARRSPRTTEGRAALLHAVAHIEFNAINLALDAVQRFRDLPCGFYDDWVHIAGEEAEHFTLVNNHLRTLGYAYGDFPAHDGLWEMARSTAHDSLARMALVPRVFEAHGLDVNPGMRDRVVGAGDARAGEILDVILREEVGHVAAGNRWFHYLCAERKLDPAATFAELVRRHLKGGLRGPFQRELRLAAGFTEQELDQIEAMAASGGR